MYWVFEWAISGLLLGCTAAAILWLVHRPMASAEEFNRLKLAVADTLIAMRAEVFAYQEKCSTEFEATRNVELVWLARDQAIPDPEVHGNMVSFSVPVDFLVASQGGKVEVDLNQFIQLPSGYGGILSIVDGAFADDVEMHTRILEPGWYGDVRVMLRSYAEESVPVLANTPFVRLMIPGATNIKVLKLNDQFGE